MIIYGIKKGHKKYKQHQAEKERKLLEARGQLPDIKDPSRELDTSCLAETSSKAQPKTIVTDLNRADSTSASTASALSALDHDPEFQKYMERQKELYIQSHRHPASPPSYDASVQQRPRTPSELSGSTTHPSAVAELPASTDLSVQPVEIGGQHISDTQQPVEADSTPVVFELPGNLPAILPESKVKRND